MRNLDGDRGYVCFTTLPRTLKSAARLSACLLHRVTSKLGEPPRVREKLLSSLWQVRALRPAAPACVEYCQQGTDSEVHMVWEGVAGGVPEPHGECHMANNGMWQMLQAAHLDGRNVARRDLKLETLMFARRLTAEAMKNNVVARRSDLAGACSGSGGALMAHRVRRENRGTSDLL